MSRRSLMMTVATGAAFFGTQAATDEPLIEAAWADRQGLGWKVTVRLSHPDKNWDHFADAWRVEDRFGRVLAMRDLMHPRVDEQPFTRSLSNVLIPDGTRVIYVRARCSQDDWGHAALPVEIKVNG